MATAEERMKILKMIQEGKISAQEGARLLAALRESRSGNQGQAARKERRRGWMRVRVTDMATGKTKLNVNLPLSLVDAGMTIATRFAPQVGVEELSAALKDAEVTGKVLDVIDEEDGEHVEIFIE